MRTFWVESGGGKIRVGIVRVKMSVRTLNFRLRVSDNQEIEEISQPKYGGVLDTGDKAERHRVFYKSAPD
jgi:hypothetical protein